MNHLVTFATEDMSQAAMLCHRSALMNGADQVFSYGPHDVQRLRGYEQSRAIFDAPRGAGYWAWKPALIDKVIGLDCFIRNITEGDIVVYCDAGVEIIDNLKYIVDRMDQDVFVFGNNYEHAHWCKADIARSVWPATDKEFWQDDPWSRFGKQVQASVIFFRVSEYTRKFVKEWLDWCVHPVTIREQKDGRMEVVDRYYLIDDSPSHTPNHPEFRENRHDQAILTTMAYRDGIKLHWWPAMYNDGAFVYERGGYPDEGYPVLFHHHRRRNHEWVASSLNNLAAGIGRFNDAIQKATA